MHSMVQLLANGLAGLGWAGWADLTVIFIFIKDKFFARGWRALKLVPREEVERKRREEERRSRKERKREEN